MMLARWLESEWPGADDARRRAFSSLLEHEDDRLWDWLTGREEAPAGLRDIVSRIRGATFGHAGR